MKARKIAFVSEHASPLALLGSEDAGGQNVYVNEVSRHLAHLGHRVDIFSRRDCRDVENVVEWAPNVRVINLEAGPPTHLCRDGLWPLMPEFRDSMLRYCRQQRDRYDVVHGHFWMSGWVATQLRHALQTPAVQTFHATGVTKRRHQGENDTSPADRIAIERQIVHLCDRLIAQCPAEERELICDYGADPRRVTLLPAGVNPQRFRPVDTRQARHALGLSIDVPLIGYVGRVLPRKDIRNIVRALAVLRDWGVQAKLLIVGGETEEPDPGNTPEIGVLRDLARDLRVLDRVVFTGKRQQDLLWLYYGASDVMVTTPWYEPFGLTPLEAMACGRPVIGSDVGGISYTIDDGVSGHLIPPRDPTALAERLRAVIQNPDLRRRMGRAGRRRVEREFTWTMTAIRLARLYEMVLEEPAAVDSEHEKSRHAISRQTFRGRLAHIREGATFWS
jgi:glycosyltransferase involved in cell wall biosynthesis